MFATSCESGFNVATHIDGSSAEALARTVGAKAAKKREELQLLLGLTATA